MKRRFLPVLIAAACSAGSAQQISGEPKQWHDVALTFDGPATSETDYHNPFGISG